MMYLHNFAAAIKVNGKILREFGDTVYLPFGSEYAIRLKNLNTSRAKVTIEIDGDIVTGNDLILNSNETFDLERFIRNGNLSEGNRFKFIERTTKIEDHRGIKFEDGLITIRYEFEITLPYYPQPATLYTQNYRRSAGGARGMMMRSSFSSDIYGAMVNHIPVSNDTGITVEGSKSSQSFSTTYWNGSVGDPYSMTIRLLGETEDNKVIREPVTVNTRLECKTCGTNNPATSKFCSECGTALEII